MRTWGRALLVLAGLGFAAYLFYRIGPGVVWDSVATLGWRLLLVVSFPYSAAAVLDTLGWRLLLPGAPVRFTRLLRARLAGEAVNIVTPTASVGGEPLKAYLLRPGVPLAEGFAAVILDKTTTVAGQGLFLLAGLLLAAPRLSPSSSLLVAMTSLLAVEIVAVSGFILAQIRGAFGGGGRALGRIGARLGLGPGDRYQDDLKDLDRRLASFYRDRRARLVGSALLHGAAWAAGGIEIYLVVTFLGIPASLVTVLVIESFAAAVKFASFMIPASLGALEGGYVAFFGALGLGGATGLSYTLVRRLREATWAAVGFLVLPAPGARRL